MGQRLIITEEERNEILKLHKSFIFEGPDDVLGNQGTPVSGATNSGPGIVNTVNQPGLPDGCCCFPLHAQFDVLYSSQEA